MTDPYATEAGRVKMAMREKWCRCPSHITIWRHQPPGKSDAGDYGLFWMPGRKGSAPRKRRKKHDTNDIARSASLV